MVFGGGERGETMKSGPITIGMRGESSGLPGTDYGDYVKPDPPVQFPGKEGILTCIYNQVREEEHVISVQFLGSQQKEKEEASRGYSC